MKKSAIFPGKYIQGEGVLGEIGSLISNLGAKKPMLVWGPRARAASSPLVLASLDAAGVGYFEHPFCGECTREEAAAIESEIAANGCDIVVGLGGGKCLDVAKGAAAHLGLRMVCAPTVCSCDAPTSACTVWYDAAGVCTGFDLWPFNPDVVICDTGVMITAPEHMLKAGIADALATYLEARASNHSHAVTCAGGAPTLTVMALSRLCFDILFETAELGLCSVRAGVVTPAYDRLVEACSLLSGIGWESGGLCTAHVLGNNLSSFPEAHHHMHGEKVAFGIVTQLMLDVDQDMDEAYEIVDFMVGIGLPVTFADLSLNAVSKERLLAWCEANTQPGSFTNNHNFPVSGKDLYNAMIAADAFGTMRKQALAK